MNRHRALAAFRSSEAGFAIMETVVSAAVLAMVAFAVLAGIDGASSSTGREKARSVAASLAEQDQERMRSMQVDSLAGYAPAPQTVNVDGADYTIESEGRWISDSTGGTPSCQNNSTQADYLQISSKVTTKTIGTRTQPVEIKSLVAPSVLYSSSRGSLAVQVNNRNGVGIEGIAVTITGPASPPAATTNEQGCALFQYIPVGNYDITLNRIGWVDHFGQQQAQGNQDVSAGTLNVRTMNYDQAGAAVATIGTYRPGSTTAAAANLLPSKARRVSATNGGEPGMKRIFSSTPANAMVPSLTLSDLFPFNDEYGVFTGTCDESSPVNYDPDYYPNFTGAVRVDPGATGAVTVRQPPLNIQVRRRLTSTTWELGNLISVRAYQLTSSGCTEPSYTLTTMTNPATGTNGWMSQTGGWDPGLPFGEYSFCLFDPTNSRRKTYDNSGAGYDNTQPLGRSSTLLIDNTGWTTGFSSFNSACPA